MNKVSFSKQINGVNGDLVQPEVRHLGEHLENIVAPGQSTLQHMMSSDSLKTNVSKLNHINMNKVNLNRKTNDVNGNSVRPGVRLLGKQPEKVVASGLNKPKHKVGLAPLCEEVQSRNSKTNQGKNTLASMALEKRLDIFNPLKHNIGKNLQHKYGIAYMRHDFKQCSLLLKTSRNMKHNTKRYLNDIEAQAWFNIPALDKISTMCDKITSVASEGSDCFSNINEILNSIKNYYSNDNDILSKSAGILADTALLYKSSRDVTSVISYLVAVAARFNITAIVIEQIFTSWHNRITGLFAQAGETEEEGFFGAIVETICTLMGWKPDMTNFLSGLSLYGRGLTGLEKIHKLVMFGFTWIRDCFFRNVYGCTYSEYQERQDFPRLTDFIQACQVLTEIKEEYINTDAKICQLIQEVNILGSELLNEARKESSLRVYINTLLRNILPIVEKAKRSPAMAKTNRNVPYAVYIYGPAGVGKTNLMHILIARMYKRYIKNYVPGYRNCYHSRKAENEYFDGYLHQPFLVYDDIFQVKDLPSSANPEVMEIIRAINDDPFQLHMASVEDKKSTYMDSEFVIATSNSKIPAISSITCPNAVYRRFPTAISVKVKPEFGKFVGSADGDNATGQSYWKVDPTKMECELETHFYEITEYNLADGKTLATYSFEEFVEELFARVDKHREKHDSRTKLLQSLAGEEVYDIDQSECLQYQQKLRQKLNGVVAESFMDGVPGVASAGSVATRLISKLQQLYEAASTTVDGYIPFYTSSVEKFSKLAERTRTEAVDAVDVFKRNATVLVDKILEHKFALLLPLLCTCAYFLFKYYQCPLLSIVKPEDVFTVKFCSCERCKFTTSLVKVSAGIRHPEKRFNESLQILGMLMQRYPDKDLVTVISPMLIFRASDSTRNYKHIKAEHSSGDSKTLTPKLSPRAEHSSGDYKTRAVARNLIAEVNSGDYETRKDVRRFMAENSSGDFETLKRQLAFLSAETDNLTNATNAVEIDGKVVAQVGDLNYVEQFQSVVARNIVLLKDASEQVRINAVFVTGRTVLVPYHFYTLGLQGAETFFLVNPFQNSLKTPISMKQCFFHRIVDKNGELVDAMLISLPLSIPARPCILEKFAKANDMGKLGEGEVVVAGLNVLKGIPVVKTTTAIENQVVTAPLSYPDASGIFHKINQYIMYTATTAHGDCGSLLFARNTLVSGKILGIHVAGDSKRGYGISLAISQENLARNMDVFARTVNDPRHFVKGNFAAQIAVVHPELARENVGIRGDYLPIGYLTEKVGRPLKTELRESLIHNDVYETLTKPAFLAPQKRGNEIIDPLRKGMEKVCNVLPIVDEELLEIAVHDVSKQYTHTNDDIRRVLKYEEALQGVEDREFAAPINRSTSPGYPYNINNSIGGKHKWLGRDEEWILDHPELLNDVTRIIENARGNKRSDIIFTATLKDERRPHVKVDELKTRVFEAAPLAYVVAMRKYYLGFIEHVMRNRIDNEVCVGTNHLSLDWHRIGCKLQSKGSKVIAGDFSNFDGSLHQQILWKINNIINDWYDGTAEETQIRNVLFEEVCNTIVNVDGNLIQQTHSQPSGNPLTVIINSVYNQIVMRYAYLYCKKEAGLPLMCDFTQKVGFVTYGDDNCANIADDVSVWYNQVTITRALATIGLTYTDEAKTGNVVNYRTIHEINFLKRMFVIDQWGFWKAPILIHVPRDMANWVRGKQIRASTKLNCETSLMEFALHGKNVYNEESKKLIKACQRKGLKLNVPHYLEWVNFFAHQREICKKM